MTVRLPSALVPHHGVQDGEPIVHGGGQGDLRGVASGPQAGVEGADDQVPACGRERGPVQGGAYRSTAPSYLSAPVVVTTVTVEGRHADQGCDLAVADVTQFRQFR